MNKEVLSGKMKPTFVTSRVFLMQSDTNFIGCSTPDAPAMVLIKSSTKMALSGAMESDGIIPLAARALAESPASFLPWRVSRQDVQDVHRQGASGRLPRRPVSWEGVHRLPRKSRKSNHRLAWNSNNPFRPECRRNGEIEVEDTSEGDCHWRPAPTSRRRHKGLRSARLFPIAKIVLLFSFHRSDLIRLAR